VRIALIADTHMPRGTRALPARCIDLLSSSDLVVHAGDWSTREVVEQIRALGPPVHGVVGNVDSAEVRAELPAETVLQVAGVALAVTHDAGPRVGRLARMRRRFPAADAVVFGHSHIPLHEWDENGFQIFNPGSPTERRRSPAHTMGLARIRDGAVAFELIALD
jgi:putative phosphoesterase